MSNESGAALVHTSKVGCDSLLSLFIYLMMHVGLVGGSV
jgi:hypothetical protein